MLAQALTVGCLQLETWTGGVLKIPRSAEGNKALTTIRGLSNLVHVRGKVSIEGNPRLIRLDGIAPIDHELPLPPTPDRIHRQKSKRLK